MTRRWFLPETPDLLGMLRDQARITTLGLRALVAWAEGKAGADDHVRDLEHQADEAKRALWAALRSAFTTPIEPEDLYTLSALLDAVINQAKDAVREAEVMQVTPDDHVVEMARQVMAGVEHLDEAFGHLAMKGGDHITESADAAIKCQRNLEREYRLAMSELVANADVRAVAERREMYRRFSRMGDSVIAVAERVWYAVVKSA